MVNSTCFSTETGKAIPVEYSLQLRACVAVEGELQWLHNLPPVTWLYRVLCFHSL